jgi:hypothetical protein
MRASFSLWLLAGLTLMLPACGQFSKLQIHDKAFLDDQKIEESYQKSSALQAKGENGEALVVNKETLRLLHDIRQRLEKVSGQSFEYAIVDSDSHSHLLMSHDNKEYVTFSIQFLDKFGSDPDILAAVIAHDLSHIADKDTGDAMDNREIGFFVARQIISAALSVVGTPIAGYAASAALSGAEQAEISLQEDKVNPVGLQWLLAAGYTPCGYLKIQQYHDENANLSSPLKYLGSHPGVSARAQMVQDHLAANPQIVCPLPTAAKKQSPADGTSANPGTSTSETDRDG